MHKHKLNYDALTRQVKILGMDVDQIITIKEQILPALTSTLMNVKFKGRVNKRATYIASIHAPHSPMISGMQAVVSLDNNNCKINIENCAPYNVVIKRNEVIGLVDMETEDLIPPEDSAISSIFSDINTKLPKVPKKKLSKEENAPKAHLNVPSEFKQ